MQKPTGHKKKVMVKCDIPVEHLKALQDIRAATGMTASKLFAAMLDRGSDDFKVDDIPMEETGILRLYLDRDHLTKLKSNARDHNSKMPAFIRATIAHALARISKQSKS